MIQAQRKCIVKGHANEAILRICIHPKCNRYTRRICIQCQLENPHQHGEQSNYHIVDNEKLQKHLMQHYTQIDNNNKNFMNLNNMFSKMSQLEQLLQYYIKSLPNITEILKKVNNDLNTLDTIEDIELQEILNVTYQEWQQKMQKIILESVQSLKLYIIYIEQLLSMLVIQGVKVETEIVIQEIQGEHQDMEQKFLEQIQNLDQYFQYCQIRPNIVIHTSQISRDERYLAIGGDNQTIIYDMQSKTEIAQLQIKKHTQICKFSGDSKFFYIGTQDGYLLCFDLGQSFTEIYRKSISKLKIHNLIEIENQVLLSSSQSDICRVDIKSDEILKIANFHQSRIYALDYDSTKKIIASGSDDRIIKITNAENLQQQWESKLSHNSEIIQVQFIPQDQLLSLDFEGVLKLQQIDHEKQLLIEKLSILVTLKITKFQSYVRRTLIQSTLMVRQYTYMNTLINKPDVKICQNIIISLGDSTAGISQLYYDPARKYNYYLFKSRSL